VTADVGDGTRPSSPLGVDLAGLYDCARLSRELGISRAAAEAIMRRLPKQTVPGLRKVYVRGADVQALLDEHVVAA
jgi:hypothetical protein